MKRLFFILLFSTISVLSVKSQIEIKQNLVGINGNDDKSYECDGDILLEAYFYEAEICKWYDEDNNFLFEGEFFYIYDIKTTRRYFLKRYRNSVLQGTHVVTVVVNRNLADGCAKEVLKMSRDNVRYFRWFRWDEGKWKIISGAEKLRYTTTVSGRFKCRACRSWYDLDNNPSDYPNYYTVEKIFNVAIHPLIKTQEMHSVK